MGELENEIVLEDEVVVDEAETSELNDPIAEATEETAAAAEEDEEVEEIEEVEDAEDFDDEVETEEDSP